MPMITDWLMVGITAAYVFATIKIYSANIKSVNSAKEQLEEMKQEHDENKRLGLMPYFEILICDDITDFPESIILALSSKEAEISTIISRRISIENIGLGPAKDVRYVWHNSDSEHIQNDLDFTAILPGEQKDISIDFFVGLKDDFSEYKAPVSLTFTYYDLLENKYHLRIDLVFTVSTEDNVKLTKYTIGKPCIEKEQEPRNV